MSADDFPLEPDAVVPFHAYRRQTSPRIFELAPSLSHFYEAEKFRNGTAAGEYLRLEVLACPTAKAARKLARRHLDVWREDWKAIRARVFRAGLAMQRAQSPEIRDKVKAIAAEPMAWTSNTTRIGGLPVSWMAQQVATLQHGRQDRATPRLSLLVLEQYAPADLAARLNALFAGEMPHGVALYVGEDSCHSAEAWSMQVAAPILYIGDPARRMRASECDGLLTATNLLVVCAPPTRKETRDLVKRAKQKKLAIRDLTVAPPRS